MIAMADMSNKTETELQKSLADKRESLRVFRHSSAGTRTRNTREGRTIRKEIARIMTELSTRRIASKGKIA